MQDNRGYIKGISGSVVTSTCFANTSIYEVVYVGSERLLGEVVRVRRDVADIQVYEDTTGLQIGDHTIFTGELLSMKLAPGLLGQVLDGIGRPLERLGKKSPYISRGTHIDAVDDSEKWYFIPRLQRGDDVGPGDILGEVEEKGIKHFIMAPLDFRGKDNTISWMAPKGEYVVDDVICKIGETTVKMFQRWNIRTPRKVGRKLDLDKPLLTGTRILDVFFPLALGGTAVIPGGFGTGKTVTQQSIARWANADIVIYIGCGERGNEMTEVLEEFPSLTDVRRGIPLMDRMILIANTSNMPVAAREASIYLGMTIAEYYRDMGYNVAIIADSISRWAEALREISGRLEEMPGEEGYPAYLASRLARYYERAGNVVPLGSPQRNGSISVINAISPPGGDFSEPVTQSGLRLSGCFWALDKGLATKRHFPSINWAQSYSLYHENLDRYFTREISEDWVPLREFVFNILHDGKSLQEMVQIVGRDGLTEEEKWILKLSELINIFYLQQNAFDPNDAYCDSGRQLVMLNTLKLLDEQIRGALNSGVLFEQIDSQFAFVADLMKLRSQNTEDYENSLTSYIKKLKEELSDLI
ncbi:V-type ATP synthase subunit A [Acetomicrobium sp. UBA5826]|uniref:V-type ATP synthase subunit A n=1 Tax=Acetomicrobium sp. UBA5826 TaxID=1946039 RepID=UPI00257B815F|nr:V-type ATP synthase subunit A [Acetomicrobium sp. UBA5826]